MVAGSVTRPLSEPSFSILGGGGEYNTILYNYYLYILWEYNTNYTITILYIDYMK